MFEQHVEIFKYELTADNKFNVIEKIPYTITYKLSKNSTHLQICVNNIPTSIMIMLTHKVGYYSTISARKLIAKAIVEYHKIIKIPNIKIKQPNIGRFITTNIVSFLRKPVREMLERHIFSVNKYVNRDELTNLNLIDIYK